MLLCRNLKERRESRDDGTGVFALRLRRAACTPARARPRGCERGDPAPSHAQEQTSLPDYLRNVT